MHYLFYYGCTIAKQTLFVNTFEAVSLKLREPCVTIGNSVAPECTCINPKPLDKALKCCDFPLPTIGEILPDLSKAKVFTVCDAKSGFWHVQLEEESSYLTTFATLLGQYRWLRMPMGISPAPEIFQRTLTLMLNNVHGPYISVDDILITKKGETQEEAENDHNEKLKQFLDRFKETSTYIQVNAEKFRLRERETVYIGHRLTADGLKPVP